MDPSIVFCATETCPDKGRVGAGNIGIHSQKKRRYRCHTCGDTFSATRGTPYYRLHKDAWLMTAVLVLLAHGCPPPAIVAAFGLDARTVTAWLHRAGGHCAALHTHLIEGGQVEVGHVQADEIRVKVRGGVVWQAMAVALPSRLWLGGVVGRSRDGALVTRLLERVRACAASRALLLCVDGFAAYVGAARTVFREPVYTGTRGRPRLILPAGFLLAQVVKSRQGRRLAEITRRVVVGTEDAVTRVIAATRGGTAINTAYIERLNATFRAHLAPLTRRGRGIAHGTALVESGMWLVGCAYNFCWTHESLRLRAIRGHKWQERTPAMAAGLADHAWTMDEMLRYPIPPRARTVTPQPPHGRTHDHGRLLPFPTRPVPPPTGRVA
jgi:transposase-like protein